MYAYFVETLIHLTHACIRATKHQGQRGACARHVSFSWDTSSVPVHFTSMKVWVTDTKNLTHRQKGLVSDQGRNMHSFVNKLRLEVNLSMIWRWTQVWENISSLRTTQDSQFRGWPGNEFNFDKSATHWELLKTQENVDDWDLDSPLRNQQLLDDTASFWATSYRLWAAHSQSSALALACTPSMDQYL